MAAITTELMQQMQARSDKKHEQMMEQNQQLME